MTEAGFVNFSKQQSNSELLKTIPIYQGQAEKIRKGLTQIKEVEATTKAERTRVNTLLTMVTYLEYLGENLSEYLLAGDILEQYSALTTQIQTDGFLTQALGLVKTY